MATPKNSKDKPNQSQIEDFLEPSNQTTKASSKKEKAPKGEAAIETTISKVDQNKSTKAPENVVERKVKTHRIRSEIRKIRWSSRKKANKNFAITFATIASFAIVFFLLSYVFLDIIGFIGGITLGS